MLTNVDNRQITIDDFSDILRSDKSKLRMFKWQKQASTYDNGHQYTDPAKCV